jgi:hypothetical protein
MKADLLLVGDDGAPIVGEVKAATGTRYDTDPMLALIQAVTLATQLATPAQRERLRATYATAAFTIKGELDVYVFLVKPALEAKATYQAALGSIALELARSLIPVPGVPIARIEFIETRWEGELRLKAVR